MPYVNYESLAITATSSGSITAYTSKSFTGFLEYVQYVASATTSDVFGNTASTIAITGERTSMPIISIATPATSAVWPVRLATVTTAGAASTGSAKIPLYSERLVVTVTSGSTDATTKNANIRFYVS